MKKTLIAILATCTVFAATAALAACGGPEEEGTYYTVTYMDGTEVLKTERVKEGERPEAFVPEKEGGYQFVDWFATPSTTGTMSPPPSRRTSPCTRALPSIKRIRASSISSVRERANCCSLPIGAR